MLISVGAFLTINLFFINRRMKDVLCLKDEVLQMASGNLKHPVPDCGEDEIGILAEELDVYKRQEKDMPAGAEIC